MDSKTVHCKTNVFVRVIHALCSESLNSSGTAAIRWTVWGWGKGGLLSSVLRQDSSYLSL